MMINETESAQKSVARGFIHEVSKSLGHLHIDNTETIYGIWRQKVNNVIDFLAQEVWLFDPGDPKV